MALSPEYNISIPHPFEISELRDLFVSLLLHIVMIVLVLCVQMPCVDTVSTESYDNVMRLSYIYCHF